MKKVLLFLVLFGVSGQSFAAWWPNPFYLNPSFILLKDSIQFKNGNIKVNFKGIIMDYVSPYYYV